MALLTLLLEDRRDSLVKVTDVGSAANAVAATSSAAADRIPACHAGPVLGRGEVEIPISLTLPRPFV